MISCLFFALFTITAVAVWFFYRGDLHSDQWVRDAFIN
jgi:hypothetical protein